MVDQLQAQRVPVAQQALRRPLPLVQVRQCQRCLQEQLGMSHVLFVEVKSNV